MPNDSSFEMSQGIEVIQPKRGKAFPIPCEEWDFLKEKILEISDKIDAYHTAGSLLVGAGISTSIAIIFGAYRGPDQSDDISFVIACAAAIVLLFCGCVCFWFSKESKSVNRVKARDIAKQMDIIENRYERGDANAE